MGPLTNFEIDFENIFWGLIRKFLSPIINISFFWCMGTCNKSTCSERVCTDPPILGHLQLPVAARHLQQPPAAATSSNINHLQLFLQLAAATCSNISHLQLFLQLAVATCSNIKNLPRSKSHIGAHKFCGLTSLDPLPIDFQKIVS